MDWEKTNPNEPKRTQTNPNKPNLRNAEMNATVCLARNYEKNPAPRLRENKPNSKPISEKPNMNANSFLAKDYERKSLRGINPIQTQFFRAPRFLPPAGRVAQQTLAAPSGVVLPALILPGKTCLKIELAMCRCDTPKINIANCPNLTAAFPPPCLIWREECAE